MEEKMDSFWNEELMWPLTPDEEVGKILIEAIAKARKEFKDETGILPDLILIHPMSMRYINMYAYKTQPVVYSHKDNIPVMPNEPGMTVLCDTLRKNGTFLVTTRKLLERSGIKGGIS